HRITRDDAGARRGRTQEHLRAAVVRKNFVRNGGVLQEPADHLWARHLPALADRIGHFARFAQTYADPATLVAYDDERAEIKTAPALDDLGGTVDEDDLFRQFVFLAVGAYFRGLGA